MPRRRLLRALLPEGGCGPAAAVLDTAPADINGGGGGGGGSMLLAPSPRRGRAVDNDEPAAAAAVAAKAASKWGSGLSSTTCAGGWDTRSKHKNKRGRGRPATRPRTQLISKAEERTSNRCRMSKCLGNGRVHAGNHLCTAHGQSEAGPGGWPVRQLAETQTSWRKGETGAYIGGGNVMPYRNRGSRGSWR